MKIILSTKLRDSYKGYKVVSTLDDVLAVKDLDCLILHTFSEDDYIVGLTLANLTKRGVSKFAYMCDEPVLLVRLLISGLDGLVDDADFYFSCEEDLDMALEDFFNSTSVSCSSLESDTKILTDFLTGFANNDDRIKAPVVLEQVNSAINNLMQSSSSSELVVRDVGKTTIDTFRKVSKTISALSEQHKDLQAKFNSLENSTKNIRGSVVKQDTSVGWAFPSYQYIGSSRVLYVREYSPCRYLTSFILSYANYVNHMLSKTCKVVFIHARGQGVSRRYCDGFTNITSESDSKEELYLKPIIATNIPRKSVMDKLTHTGEALIIIVDRLYSQDNIISGQKIFSINAVSGISDLKRFGLDINKTMFPIVSVKDAYGHIPHINSFPKDDRTRKSKYFDQMKDVFIKLDKATGLSNDGN